MAKKPTEVGSTTKELAAHENHPAAAWQKVLEISDDTLVTQKINEISKLLWVDRGADKDVGYARLLRALELYESLEPADGAEGMLALQMVGTHEAALECLRRAALPGQTYEGRDMALKHAQKLMTLYAKQLETLNKHRGKGQQKVTVEHVNVQAGGQAIVGSVEAGKRGPQQNDADPTLEHHREVLGAEEAPESRAPRKNRSG